MLYRYNVNQKLEKGLYVSIPDFYNAPNLRDESRFVCIVCGKLPLFLPEKIWHSKLKSALLKKWNYIAVATIYDNYIAVATIYDKYIAVATIYDEYITVCNPFQHLLAQF
ncbi:unnamed protein product [Bemisia tabaci]|uniref:Uncharacterized protein n=1 Tax=Bemisia tabaci TaxID=7038 RepID=A0A9P0A5L5_BEMTA|nr:unnamed protein product [Bemisia tabaci]